MLESFILWLLASILAAAVACYLRLIFTGRGASAPWYVVPLITLVVAILLVLLVPIALPPVGGPQGPVFAILAIAWGGWMLSARV